MLLQIKMDCWQCLLNYMLFNNEKWSQVALEDVTRKRKIYKNTHTAIQYKEPVFKLASLKKGALANV